MRKFIVLLLLLTGSLGLQAALPDAFKDIYPPTDKKVMKSLNGTWHLKVIRGVNRDPRVPERDATWGTIPVPGCLEQYGFSKARYSLPDSLTGYYRTSFTVPAEWKGQRVCIRLDGVLRGYDLWLNGQQVGTWEMPYNTCLFDLTPYLTKKAFKGEEQQLALHVYSRYKGFEFDCFDDWAPMGIFRDVTLFTVPDTHLADMTVTTRNTGEVNVATRVANATKNTKVDYEVLDDQGRVVTTSPNQKIASPKLWTAETPYLYTLRVNVRDKKGILQTFTQKIGLRELRIDEGKVLKLNGQPIKFRGVTCHATDPRTVKVIGDTLTLKDMRLMKAASINYIRTSHYPREPRFYELCDSLGFYVICEVPFGSRGAKHLSDTSYYSNLCARARATIYRHKNYPSVLIWSLGNENPFPKSCVRLGEYAKQLDTTRYICYPEKGCTFRAYNFKNFPTVADIYAPHYPTTGQVGGFYQHADRSVIFTEYLHTLGISFEDHDRQWEIIEKTPAIAGGSVWEWVDQGMPFKAERTNPYGYEERVFTSPHGGFEMNGNQGTDGLLYADRTPLPNYYELQHNYAQAAITDTTFTGTLHVRNRYDFINLKDNV
ncbi:MAG: glycoside hydrolase family 2 TIM barrel-domain containing protein, partial [Prevotella sp.]|nr:glycoside hydrolase family 2 TIM barrel-domain containing protein [Prevotella sp.]